MKKQLSENNITEDIENDNIQISQKEQLKKIRKELRILKENEHKKIYDVSIFLSGIVLSIICFFDSIWMLGERYWKIKDLILPVAIGFFVSLIAIVYRHLYIDMRKTKCETTISEFEKENIVDQSQEDIYETSIQMSYKYLDQYYLQTREQAQKGFMVTITVAIVGGIIIAVGIISMFLGKGNPAYVTTASGVIIEFISAIFFYLYNKTIRSMGDYHTKLVLSQNVSVALKLSDSLSTEAQDDVKATIIKELVRDINQHVDKNNLTENK